MSVLAGFGGEHPCELCVQHQLSKSSVLLGLLEEVTLDLVRKDETVPQEEELDDCVKRCTRAVRVGSFLLPLSPIGFACSSAILASFHGAHRTGGSRRSSKIALRGNSRRYLVMGGGG